MSTNAGSIKACAKINLGLKILAREESGFHSIETIFHKIELADEIRLQVTESGKSISVSGTRVTAGGDEVLTRRTSRIGLR